MTFSSLGFWAYSDVLLAKLWQHQTLVFLFPNFQLICLCPSFQSPCSFCLSAAAAPRLLQSCPTLCDPIDGSPLGSSVPGILQARILEWAAISLPISQKSGFIFKSQFIPRCSSCITVQKRVHKCHHTSVAVHLASSENPVVGESTWMPFPLYSS